MTSTSAINPAAPSSTPRTSGSGIKDVDLDGFLKLMITEMQNQDPLDPMENSEMLQQLSQMRSIGATDKLTSTLDAVLLGQNLTTASSLIGKVVSALTDEGENIEGRVDRVSVAPGQGDEPAAVKIHIGDRTVSLGNIREILPSAGSA